MLARTTLRQANQLARRRYATATGGDFQAERQAVKQHAADTSSLWRKISIWVCIPATIVCTVNAYNLAKEHEAHQAEHPTEMIAYPYRNIRVKNFPWGDGDKTIFWNDNVNHQNPEE